MSNESQEKPRSESGKLVKSLYKFHDGSIRVSGRSQVFPTAFAAYKEFGKGTRPIEFIFLGANAGQQAFKICMTAKREIEKYFKLKVVFVPLWHTVLTDSKENQPGSIKDAQIWRLVELSLDEGPKEGKKELVQEQKSVEVVEVKEKS